MVIVRVEGRALVCVDARGAVWTERLLEGAAECAECGRPARLGFFCRARREWRCRGCSNPVKL